MHVTECGGHATSIRRLGADAKFFWGYPTDLVDQITMTSLSEPQRDLAARSVVHTGTIFPNLSLIHLGLTDCSGSRPMLLVELSSVEPDRARQDRGPELGACPQRGERRV